MRLVTADLATQNLEDGDGVTLTEVKRVLRSRGQRALLARADDHDGIDTGQQNTADVPSTARFRLGFRKVDNDVQLVRRALQRGLPVVIGTSHFVQDVDTQPHNLTLANTARPVDGTHSIVVTGFAHDDSCEGGGVLQIVNSHGEAWGERGFGTISIGFYLAYAIDTHVPVRVAAAMN
jgi:hypothetical protein